MMRRRTVLLGASAAAGTLLAGAGGTYWAIVNAPPVADPPQERPPARLSPGAMRADIAAFVETLVEVGCEPFRTSSRAEFDRVRGEVEATCEQARSANEFALALGRLVAALNDGHVAVWNRPYDWHLSDGGLAPPVALRIDRDDTLVVARTAVAEVPAGSRVLAVGAHRAGDLVARTLAVTGGQTAALRRAFGRPAAVLYALDGAPAHYPLRIVTPAGDERGLRLDAMSATAFERRTARQWQPYRLRITPDRIAVVEYNACRDRPAFARFLREAFERIRHERVRAVAVDIRANGGGSSSVNAELWPYLSERPYGSTYGVRCRSCARLKREYGPFRYIRLYDVKPYFARDGEIIDQPADTATVSPPATPLRATVPTYLLIGPNTFSSALDCALTASDYRLTTLVGEETAEPVNSTGETYSFALPHSKLCATVTTKLFVSPRHPDRQGVRPDIVAPRSARDVALGRDPGLDAIRARLR